MAEIKFSYKEAIAHGWAMTKKYWKTIFIFGVIYIIFSAISGALESKGGSDSMTQYEVKEVYRDRAQAARLYQYLQEDGYINRYGRVQDKLQQMSFPEDLRLPPDLQNDRDRIFTFLDHYRYRLPFPKSVFYILRIALWLITMVMSIGFIKMFLMISRDQDPQIDELYSNWHLLIPYALGGLCYGLSVLGGFILLIIPGIIFMIMFQMYPYLIIDKGMGPIESLKRSRVITKGSRGRLVVFGLLLMLLNVVGLLCLVVGLFFTVSISYIAMAYVYDCLENNQTAVG